MNTKLLGITINRSVVILRPKQPVLDWIRAVDPNHPTETDLTELQKDCDALARTKNWPGSINRRSTVDLN